MFEIDAGTADWGIKAISSLSSVQNVFHSDFPIRAIR